MSKIVQAHLDTARLLFPEWSWRPGTAFPLVGSWMDIMCYAHRRPDDTWCIFVDVKPSLEGCDRDFEKALCATMAPLRRYFTEAARAVTREAP